MITTLLNQASTLVDTPNPGMADRAAYRLYLSRVRRGRMLYLMVGLLLCTLPEPSSFEA